MSYLSHFQISKGSIQEKRNVLITQLDRRNRRIEILLHIRRIPQIHFFLS